MEKSRNLPDIIDLIRSLTDTKQDLDPQKLRKDILGALLESFLEKYQNSDHIFESDHEIDPEIPSISGPTLAIGDSRLQYGAILAVLYDKLAWELNRLKVSTNDQYTLLSLKDYKIVGDSLQFFILTHVLPFLDEGVGYPIHKRSSIIKIWKPLRDDIAIQRKKLQTAFACFLSLCECNEAVQNEIVGKHLADLICIHEQLVNLGSSSAGDLDRFQAFLDKLSRPQVMQTLTTLSKVIDPKVPPPQWFSFAVGKRLSDELCKEGGLAATLTAYNEMIGSFWNNHPLLTTFGKKCAVPPRKQKKILYYQNITNQFLGLFEKTDHSLQGVTFLFAQFVEEMSKREQFAADVLILDMLFKPWELLNTNVDEVEVEWTKDHRNSLRLLGLWCDDKVCPPSISNSPRLIELIPILLHLFLSVEEQVQDPVCPVTIRAMHEEILTVLKFCGGKIENLTDFLYTFVVNRSAVYFELEVIKQMVHDISETNAEEFKAKFAFRKLSDDEGVVERMKAVILFVKSIEPSIGNRILVELLCKSLKRWTATNEITVAPRFVDIQNSDDEWEQLSSHLISSACFEELGEWDVKCDDPSVAVALCELIQTVLVNVSDHLEKSSNSIPLDMVRASASDEEKKIDDVKTNSARMVVGLAAAVVTTALMNEEMYQPLRLVLTQLRKFVSTALTSSNAEMKQIAADAEQTIEILKLVGIKDEEVRQNVAKVIGVAGSRPATDMITELQLDLTNEMEPIRGQALLRVARAIRIRDARVTTCLEEWLFAKVYDLLADKDSYVFLAAINALCEIACFDAKRYLTKLLDAFGELKKKQIESETRTDSEVEEERDDSALILRGKLAEAIGKVFRYLGDLAASWIPTAANVFLTAVREDNDIIRASALSAFSELIVTCRGRGIEPILDEMIYAVDQLLKTDHSDLVRRASIHLIRQILKSCESRILEILGDRLRDLRRALSHLRKWDRDHVVRLHAQICLDEIGAGLQEALDAESASYMRVIKI